MKEAQILELRQTITDLKVLYDIIILQSQVYDSIVHVGQKLIIRSHH